MRISVRDFGEDFGKDFSKGFGKDFSKEFGKILSKDFSTDFENVFGKEKISVKICTKLARSARPEGARGALRLSDWNYVQTSNQNKEVQTSNQNHFQNKEVQRAGRLRPPLGSLTI